MSFDLIAICKQDISKQVLYLEVLHVIVLVNQDEYTFHDLIGIEQHVSTLWSLELEPKVVATIVECLNDPGDSWWITYFVHFVVDRRILIIDVSRESLRGTLDINNEIQTNLHLASTLQFGTETAR